MGRGNEIYDHPANHIRHDPLGTKERMMPKNKIEWVKISRTMREPFTHVQFVRIDDGREYGDKDKPLSMASINRLCIAIENTRITPHLWMHPHWLDVYYPISMPDFRPYHTLKGDVR